MPPRNEFVRAAMDEGYFTPGQFTKLPTKGSEQYNKILDRMEQNILTDFYNLQGGKRGRPSMSSSKGAHCHRLTSESRWCKRYHGKKNASGCTRWRKGQVTKRCHQTKHEMMKRRKSLKGGKAQSSSKARPESPRA